MAEMFGKVVMWGCLAALAGLLLALVGVGLCERCGRAARRMLDAFRRLPLGAQIVVAAFVLTLIVHGSTKPTNGVPPAASAPATLDLQYDDEPSSGVFSLTELSDVQLSVGVALAEVRTNEVHDFAVPGDALVHIPWLKRGASADVFPLVLTNWCFRLGTNVHDRLYVSSSGTISFGTPMASAVRESDDVDHLAPFHTTLGVVPEANWNLLATEDSGFWHAVSPSNTAVFTWRNVLFGRDVNFPVTVQAELSEDGDVVCRYDLSSLVGATNWMDRTSIGVWNNRTGEVYNASASFPLPTSILFKHLLPTDMPTGDRDGDGLSTADELFVYRTDPDRVDTDCDGVTDYDEVLHGTNPLLADTDGDLYRDATDFNPTVADGWLDGDGDGLPDEWKNAWFGTNAVEALADADGDGISNLAALHMGVAPTGNASTDFAFATSAFASEVNAHEIVPGGFDFVCPSNLTTLLTRTMTVARTSPWQQLFVSASPHFAAGWSGEGIRLRYGLDDDPATNDVPTVSSDSWRLPLGSSNVSRVTFRLDAEGAHVSLSHPLYLLRWTPHVDFAPDGSSSMLQREGRAPLLAVRRQPASGRYEMPFTWNLSNYPHRGGVSDEVRACLLMPPVEGLPWTTDALGRTMFTAEDPLFVTLPPEGSGDALRICCYDIVLNSPNAISPGPRRSQFDAPYPLSSAAERRGFHFALNREPEASVRIEMLPGHPLAGFPRIQMRNAARLLAQSASPSNGPPYDPGTDIYPPGSATPCFDGMSDDGGTVSVDSPPPDTEPDPEPDDGEDDEDACECSGDGASFGSFRLRISLGEEHRGEPSGFVWTDIVDPTRITPGVFRILAAPNVSSVTNAAGDFTVTAAGRHGRTVQVASVPDGVLITVLNHSGRVEAKWRVFNEGNDARYVRARKLTVLDNALEDTTTLLLDEMGGYGGMVPEDSRVFGLEPDSRACVTDNLAGIMTIRQSFRTLPDEPDFVTDVFEEKYDADGNRVSAVMHEYGKFGAGTTARRRLTRRFGYDLDGAVDETRTYISDALNPLRHARLASLRSNRTGRRLHDYDERGREILREDAYEDFTKQTVTSYAPGEGDSAHRNDVDEPRDVQVFMRRNGREPVLVSHETWTYTRTRDTNAVPVRTCRHARIAGDLVQETETTAYPDDYAVPKHLRGRVVSETDGSGARRERTFTPGVWNPGDATFTASPTGTALRIVTQRSFGGVPDETADVEVVDAAQELTLHAFTCHHETLRTFDGRRFAYDDVNRLRRTEHADGTHTTNAYSCCRLLWSRGRDGRKTLRSAVTGRDRFYYADEDVWLSEASASNGFRVVQHFLDAFGRETNTVTYVGTTPGEAVDASASAGRELTRETTEYPPDGWCHSLHVDARGVETMTERESSETYEWSRESVFSPEDGDGHETTTERHRDGKVVVTQLWGDKWTCETRRSEYLDSGNRLDLVVTEHSDRDVAYDDYGIVTNSVTEYDPLGRVVATMRPGPGGAWLVTSNAYDGATTRLLASTQFAPGLAPRTTTCIHDEHGEQVGTVLDGVTNRTDVAYAEISNELWRVETSTIVGASTNAVTVTRTRLTGLSDSCRSHVATLNETTGVTTESATSFNPATKVETATATSSITTPTIRRSQYGLVLSSETSEATTHNAYDGLGRVARVTRETDELGIQPVQSFGYVPCGDLITALTYTNATDAVAESYAYDAFGNRVEETDALGNVTYRSYDPFGRVTEEGGATYPVRYVYDTQGRRTSLATTRDGETWDTTRWAYDPATGLCLSKTYADGTTTTYTHTPDGLPLRTTFAGGK